MVNEPAPKAMQVGPQPSQSTPRRCGDGHHRRDQDDVVYGNTRIATMSLALRREKGAKTTRAMKRTENRREAKRTPMSHTAIPRTKVTIDGRQAKAPPLHLAHNRLKDAEPAGIHHRQAVLQ